MKAPASDPNATPWERLPGETAKAFHAFTVYRDLAPNDRSHPNAARELGKHVSLCARWSAMFDWVNRAAAWDDEQDRQKQKLALAELEKMKTRHVQQTRLATQVATITMAALTKRAQANSNLFAEASDGSLARLAAAAARSLPQLQEAERNALANPQQKLEAQQPTKAASEASFDRGVFQYVVSRCQCGHGWDTHDQSDPDPSRMPCRMRDCECQKFVDTDELIIPPLPPVRRLQP
jgi:hypothetical protein